MPVNHVSADSAIDTTFQFVGSNGIDSHCRVRIFPRPGKHVVLLSGLDTNTGSPVTHDAARIATLVLRSYQLDAQFTLWIQNYAPGSIYDLIQFNWNGAQFSAPRWLRLEVPEVELLTGQKMHLSMIVEAGMKLD